MAAVSSSMTSFPYLAPKEWVLGIGSVSIPFDKVTVVIDGWKASMKLDVKNAPGENGASVTFQGYEIAKGTIKLGCWDQEGWNIVQDLINLVRPRRGSKTPTPFTVFHPALSALDIDRIFVESVSSPQWGSGQLTVTLDCIEFAPPPSKSAKSITKPLKIADVPDAYGASKTPPIIGPPKPPSATKPKP